LAAKSELDELFRSLSVLFCELMLMRDAQRYIHSERADEEEKEDREEKRREDNPTEELRVVKDVQVTEDEHHRGAQGRDCGYCTRNV
jgi:hypothetical protein